MRALILLTALLAATPAAAQLRAVPAQPASEKEALRGVEVFLVNEGDAPVAAEGPREIEVTAVDGTRLVLERLPAPKATIAPGAFFKARYVPVAVAGNAVPPAEAHPAATIPDRETVVQSSTGSSAAFLDRFDPHEPIYGAFGLGDAGGKLQFSLAFRPFEGAGPLDHLRFGYTQTMFWALGEPSGPFDSTIYSPEVYADVPVGERSKIAFGWRHHSNGRGAGSIDVNRIYLRGEHSFDLGGDWKLDVAPEAWFYVGQQGVATDLSDYWGYTSLTAAVRQQDGIKVALTARGNFETRRGGAELFASYPLHRIGGGLGLYLFGQAFTGHGESLDGYNVRDTHARIGIALTR